MAGLRRAWDDGGWDDGGYTPSTNNNGSVQNPFLPTNTTSTPQTGGITGGGAYGMGRTQAQQTLTPTNGAFQNGWDFGAHADTGSNLQTPKYMLSNYLISNNINPDSDWSQGAYDYLTSLGVQGVQRNGNRRLSFGDEFVDTDPTRGWQNQFFWGSNPGSANGASGMPGSSNPSGGASGGANGGYTGGNTGDLNGALMEGIMNILKGGYGADKGQLANRYESARETLDRGRKSQMGNLEATLAERGLLGSGAEASTLGRAETDLGSQYSTALRDATLAEDKIASDRYMSALDAGLGMGNLDLNTKKVMGELALGNLNSNRQWNQFLASYGLDKQRLENDISNGNIDRYMNLIKLFMQSGSDLSNGAQ